MNRPGLLSLLLRAAFLTFIAALVILPLLATFLGGFKTLGELRAAPFGIPSNWSFDVFVDILTGSVFWTYLGF